MLLLASIWRLVQPLQLLLLNECLDERVYA
jgi:hypothetical protein